ncbi:hypothetical protein PoB_005676100 [Plakobranchus ocellatus]|uniref:Uncharacterized protein n=1 Tax=Plakobranchus ocellatus TaxID=259542 RepID=A0AAV4CFV0_9GAST|nr:hypothetical protein PoB_005676100 [Plakobranchus ocellatus]
MVALGPIRPKTRQSVAQWIDARLENCRDPRALVRAPPPASRPDRRPESPRSPFCVLAIHKIQHRPKTLRMSESKLKLHTRVVLKLDLYVNSSSKE